MATWYGPNFPFYRGNTVFGVAQKVAARQEDERLIKNDLLQGLLTNPGERLFRPNFGAGVKTFLFELNDATMHTQLENAIATQISTYHPRVQFSRIEVEQNASNPHVADVSVFGSIDLFATTTEQLLVTFNLPVAGISS
jgi:phage baseplate assembly protein W